MGCGGSTAGAENGPKSAAKNVKVLPKKDVKEGGMDAGKYIVENNGKITDFYELKKKKLGEGSYGAVNEATRKDSKNIRAVKTIAKAQMKNTDRFKQEIAIMKILDHPNIIKLYETFEDHRNIYLVMELCTGGELFDRIIEVGHFNEVQAAIIMQQIIRAIFYMHENKVCHRDLKPENFLFGKKEAIEKSMLKIIDFGLSCKFDGKDLTTKAGTPYYVAPQVLAGKYDHTSDVWSCGVIMYVLLCGYPPFFGETDAEVLSKVRLGNFTFNAADWKNISEDAKSLIRMLLKMNPRDRFTAEQALNHEWIKNKAPAAKDVTLQAHMVENLKSFRGQNKLKKAALHIIASQLDDDQIKALREIFQALDANADGLLTVKEMKEGIEKSGLKDIPPDMQQIMEDVDSDGSGTIDYTEFLAATLDKKHHIQEDVVWSAFRIFDQNGDGVISKEELAAVLADGDVKSEIGALAAEALMQEVDTSGDGTIDFGEFMQMMKNQGT